MVIFLVSNVVGIQFIFSKCSMHSAAGYSFKYLENTQSLLFKKLCSISLLRCCYLLFMSVLSLYLNKTKDSSNPFTSIYNWRSLEWFVEMCPALSTVDGAVCDNSIWHIWNILILESNCVCLMEWKVVKFRLLSRILWFDLNGTAPWGACFFELEKTTNWPDDGDLIQFQFDQVLSRRGGHFSPRKSTRWSRNSEILQARLLATFARSLDYSIATPRESPFPLTAIFARWIFM